MGFSLSIARLFFAVIVFAACIALARALGNESILVPLALATPAAGLALVAQGRDLPLITRTYFVTACSAIIFPLLLMPATRPPGGPNDQFVYPIVGVVIGWILATWLNHRERIRAAELGITAMAEKPSDEIHSESRED